MTRARRSAAPTGWVDGQRGVELPQDLTPWMDEVEWMPPGFKIP